MNMTEAPKPKNSRLVLLISVLALVFALTSLIWHYQSEQRYKKAFFALKAAQQAPAAEHDKAQVDALIQEAQLSWQLGATPSQISRFFDIALIKLSPYHDEQSNALKAQLSQDVQTLKTAPYVAPEVLVNKIDALIRLISEIPMAPQDFQPTHPTTSWLGKFHGLVTVTKIDASTAKPLSLQSREWVRQNLMLKLAMTEWAVLQHQSTLYQSQLQEAYQLWQRLTLEGAQGSVIQQGFTELLATPLSPDLSLKSWEKLP